VFGACETLECRAHPDVVLFINQLHVVIGAGWAERNMDAAMPRPLPERSGVSAERRKPPPPKMAALCRDAATVQDPQATEFCGTVTEQTIAQVLSEKIGVPLEVITGHLEGMSQSRLLEMEAFLKQRVIGQDQAVARVCQRLLLAHAGLQQRRGSLGVFLFLGACRT